MAKKTGRLVIHKLAIEEVSSVDSPAQVGPTQVLLKRASENDPDGSDAGTLPLEKSGLVLTTSDKGHAHLLMLTEEGGSTSYAYMGKDGEGFHSHPWIVDAEGEITIGQALGHSHGIAVRKSIADVAGLLGTESLKKAVETQKREGDMAADDKGAAASAAAASQEVEALRKRAVALEALNADEFVFLQKLDAPGRTAFLEKSAKDRAADLQAAKDSDPVVYTTGEGVQLRKSVGDEAVRQAKRADADHEKLVELQKSADTLRLEKAVRETIPHLPGTDAEKAVLLKAVEAIRDPAEREKALAILKANDSGLAKAFERLGTTEGAKDGDEVDKLVKAYQEKHPDVDEAKATVAVLATPAGKRAYAASLS